MTPTRLGTHPTAFVVLLIAAQALLADAHQSTVVVHPSRAPAVYCVAYMVGMDTRRLGSWPRQPLAEGDPPSLERVQGVDGTVMEGRGALYHGEIEQG